MSAFLCELSQLSIIHLHHVSRRLQSGLLGFTGSMTHCPWTLLSDRMLLKAEAVLETLLWSPVNTTDPKF